MIKDTIQLISIIVPVYNCEKYIYQCINSILKQDYKTFELLLINDGSADNSLQICNEYKDKDSRIQVFSKDNGGVSSARNVGLDNVKGDYVVFVDSDDYIGESYLSDLVHQQNVNAEADCFIISDYQPFTSSGYEEKSFEDFYNIDFDKKEESWKFKKLVFDFQIFPPYCKLYKTSIIKEHYIRFNENLKSAEDFDFNIRYLKYINKISYIPSIQYYYRVGYKNYIPSNRGVLGVSEIQSVHIMCEGIVSLAQRMGILDIVEDDIAAWAANKHYFNRLRMLFADNKEIGYKERSDLYRQLTEHRTYRKMYKKGILYLPKSKTKYIAFYMDYFVFWWLFYKMHREVS